MPTYSILFIDGLDIDKKVATQSILVYRQYDFNPLKLIMLEQGIKYAWLPNPYSVLTWHICYLPVAPCTAMRNPYHVQGGDEITHGTLLVGGIVSAGFFSYPVTWEATPNITCSPFY